MSKRLIISGGGTAGHIHPAVAIAEQFQEVYPDAEILFVGAKGKMEMGKVPQYGYEIIGLWISGIQRKISLSNLLFPIKLIASLIKSRAIIKTFKPDVVVGTGGFASGPLVKMAASLKIPTLIQEQNSVAGLTNKWLSKTVDCVCVAYSGMEEYFPAHKIKRLGNPLKKSLASQLIDKSIAKAQLDLNKDKTTLLVVGGSLGAQRINELIADTTDFFNQQNLQTIWQCGAIYYERYKHLKNNHLHIYDYIQQMHVAYSAADIIISRAGAIAVSELCQVGKPVMFIPSPNVAENHQYKNAKSLQDKNAAIVLKEDQVNQFEEVFGKLINDKKQQQRLGQSMKSMAVNDAAKQIVNQLKELMQKNV
jgi:UDP-N-acetylglucosamine--N-acetylmuramyl-(pentapeptide) pyrophosphoryl-undecaprenol N-acetylglucosamine transferase